MQRNTNSFLSLTLRSNNAFTGFLTLAFLIFGFLGMINHEMWGDELQAWLIAKDSLSVFDLQQISGSWLTVAAVYEPVL